MLDALAELKKQKCQARARHEQATRDDTGGDARARHDEIFSALTAGGDGPLKPAPDPLLRILGELSVEAKDAWMVGDGPQDIGAARSGRLRFDRGRRRIRFARRSRSRKRRMRGSIRSTELLPLIQ